MKRRFKDPWEDYREDPQLRTLVDVLTSYIVQAEFTPSEVRKAAIMACTNAEMMILRRDRVFVSVSPISEVAKRMRTRGEPEIE